MTQKQLFKQAARIAALYWDWVGNVKDIGTPLGLARSSKYFKAIDNHRDAFGVFTSIWSEDLEIDYPEAASLLMSEAYA